MRTQCDGCISAHRVNTQQDLINALQRLAANRNYTGWTWFFPPDICPSCGWHGPRCICSPTGVRDAIRFMELQVPNDQETWSELRELVAATEGLSDG